MNKKYFVIVTLFFLSIFTISDELKMSSFNNGIFTIQKPNGWEITTAGQCTTLAFVMTDSKNSLNQAFHFTSVGPFYMSQQQKQIDNYYMKNSGYPIQWNDMPVVNPLTPENFLKNFSLISKTNIAKQFMQNLPHLDNLTVISVVKQKSTTDFGNTSMVRAIFKKNGKVCEGLFVCTVAQSTPFLNGPGGGNAHAWLFSGVTGEKGHFLKIKDSLLNSMKSFKLNPTVSKQCIRSIQQQYADILKASKTLNDASDIIMKGWEERNKVDDVIAEKRSDAILEKNRIFDPETGKTYYVTNDFWETYKQNRSNFEMNKLEVLEGSDYNTWMETPLNQKNIK